MKPQPERALIRSFENPWSAKWLFNVKMKPQPERALILISAVLKSIRFLPVEMEHQPERALIQSLSMNSAKILFKVEMEHQPERALIRLILSVLLFLILPW